MHLFAAIRIVIISGQEASNDLVDLAFQALGSASPISIMSVAVRVLQIPVKHGATRTTEAREQVF
jgi:hypothetical protein